MPGSTVSARDLFQIAVARQRSGAYAEAERLYRLLLAHRDEPVLRYNLGLTLLAQGRYPEGFRLYEDRVRAAPSRYRLPDFSFPAWAGEPIKSLLLWPEQGFGDCIMFARYAPVLQAQGISVTIVAPPPLAALFSALAPVIVAEGKAAFPRHDAWALFGSLPHLCGTDLTSVPPPVYLKGGGRGRGIGYAWRGRTDPPNNASRALPAPDLPGTSLDPEDTGAKTFAETAEIIRGMALVISVDTAIAHLAASMGVPTWVLLTDDGVCWRWMRDRDRSPWYPDARLFRQAPGGDWAPVIERVKLEAAHLSADAPP